MNHFRFICAFFFLGLISLLNVSVANADKSVKNIRVWHSPHNTRVVLDVSKDVKHSVFTLDNPLRLVVDINDIRLSTALPELQKDNKHITAIRAGSPSKKNLRLVFELKQQLEISSFVLSPNELYGHRLVIDLVEPEGASELIQTQENNDQTNTKEVKELTVQDVAPPARINKPLVISIDAGHGGEDPGAIGHRGNYEKKITLAISKKLQKLIDANPVMQSRLVRTGDYFVKLHKRRQIARDVKSDMFISIHADAFTKKSARGFSVFALSQRGATSAMARAIAAKENAADLIGGVSLKDKDDVVAKVLVDLSMTNTISESLNFGGRVLKKLGKVGKLHSKRVEQAGFAVLKSPDIPSILVETGFITNPTEEKNLTSDWYQQKVAQAIYEAIDEYYQQTPHYANAKYASPSITSGGSRNTASKASSKPTKHKVVRGDSLSKIAQRYGVSMRSIKRLNKLKSNTVMLGQRLKIPGSGGTSSSSNKPPRNTSRNTARSSAPIIHTVKRGDSLSKISARYNVKIKWIKSTNNLRKDTLVLGQKLRIPSGGLSSKPSKPKKPRSHKVKRGDTLSGIALKYRTSVKAIVKANKLRNNNVMLGQTLKIP